MIKRTLQQKLLLALEDYPIIALIGPRQVGKTTLAKEVAKEKQEDSIYLDLESEIDNAKLMEPELYFRQHNNALIILDEIQRKPELFPILRSIVDRSEFTGKFLLLGSSSPDLIKHSSESLAGRIKYFELTPFLMTELEVSGDRERTLWERGGFPLSFLKKNHAKSLDWRQEFITTFLERDIPQLGIRISPQQLRKFWTMLAHWHGQVWNASRFAGNFGVSSLTIKHYLDILTGTFLVRQLQPYHRNVKKRLVKSPKIYLRDSGLLHALLKITDHEDLLGSPYLGVSWEGFAIEQILGALPEHTETYFYRTHRGAEIDLVINLPKRGTIAVEIKHSATPKLSRGFTEAFTDINAAKGYVIMKGDETFPLRENVWAMPLNQFIDDIRGDI